MRTDASVANGDTALAALMRETAAATVDTVLAELRRRPIVQPEWLSLQDAATYTGYSEQQFSAISSSAASRRRASYSVATRGVSSAATLTLGGGRRPECLYLQGRARRCAQMNRDQPVKIEGPIRKGLIFDGLYFRTANA